MGLIWTAIISAFGILGAIIIAVAGRLLSDDVKEWLPWITRHLIERAVSRLPENEREKRREEWESDVDEWPGNLAKVYRAWGYLSAAKAIHRIAVSGEERMRAALDLAIAAALLAFLSPLLCIVALCIKLDSPGPVTVGLRRFGVRGRPFHVLKFRTMAVKTDVPRVTRVGRIIRLVSVDELPQLINVLRGEMSLVGPRARPRADKLASVDPTLLSTKPGITGWAQLKGFETTKSDQQELEDDLYYIRNKSLKLYLLILWRTVSLLWQTDRQAAPGDRDGPWAPKSSPNRPPPDSRH
jgi:lipopolysaccharide/colanic/teichoic acid biosynthesis glycosyltransferase